MTKLSIFTAVVVALSLPILSCTPGGGGGGTSTAPTPSGASCQPYGFASNFGPTAVSRTLPGSTMGAVCLTGQTFSGTFSFTIDIQGFRDSVGICVPDGVYKFATRGMVNGACFGPTTPMVTVTVAADYVGDFRRTNPVCIQTS